MEFVAVLIEDEHFLAPGLIDLAREDLADLLGVLFVNIGLLNIHNTAGEILAYVEYAAASEGLELDLLGVLVTDFVIVITAVGLDLLESHLGVRVLHLFHNLEVLVDFAGTLVDIHNNIEVVR